METISLNVEFLAKLLNTTPGDLSAAVKKDDDTPKEASAIQSAIEGFFDKSLSAKLSAAKKEAREEGHGRGKSEALKPIQKQLAEEYEIEDPGTLPELVKAIVTKATATKVDAADVEKSEVFIKATKALSEKNKALQAEFDQFKSDTKTKALRSDVDALVEKLAREQFDLGDDEVISKTHLDNLKKAVFASAEWASDDEGKLVVAKDGKPLRDDRYEPVSLDDHITGIAKSYFKPKQPAGPKSAEFPPKRGEQIEKAKPATFSNDEEYYKLYNAAEKIEDKRALVEQRNALIAEDKYT